MCLNCPVHSICLICMSCSVCVYLFLVGYMWFYLPCLLNCSVILVLFGLRLLVVFVLIVYVRLRVVLCVLFSSTSSCVVLFGSFWFYVRYCSICFICFFLASMWFYLALIVLFGPIWFYLLYLAPTGSICFYLVRCGSRCLWLFLCWLHLV